MLDSIIETRNYNDCMSYIENLEHFYIGAKLSDSKSKRIKEALECFCRERPYVNNDSRVVNCSSVNSFGDDTLNTMIRSPMIPPSREIPFPLIIFSSRF